MSGRPDALSSPYPVYVETPVVRLCGLEWSGDGCRVWGRRVPGHIRGRGLGPWSGVKSGPEGQSEGLPDLRHLTSIFPVFP